METKTAKDKSEQFFFLRTCFALLQLMIMLCERVQHADSGEGRERQEDRHNNE